MNSQGLTWRPTNVRRAFDVVYIDRLQSTQVDRTREVRGHQWTTPASRAPDGSRVVNQFVSYYRRDDDMPRSVILILCAMLTTVTLSPSGSAAEPDWEKLLTPIHPATETAVQLESHERLLDSHDGGAVLVAGSEGSFDLYSVAFPHVHFDGKLYRMWYSGGPVSPHYHGKYGAIRLATSKDGVHWQRANGGKPVLEPAPEGAFDEAPACCMKMACGVCGTAR